jgi:hypothetical protein
MFVKLTKREEERYYIHYLDREIENGKLGQGTKIRVCDS